MRKSVYLSLVALLLLQMFIPSNAYLGSILTNSSSNKSRQVSNDVSKAPKIDSLSKDISRLEGGDEVIITEHSFLPETLLVLGDCLVKDFTKSTLTIIDSGFTAFSANININKRNAGKFINNQTDTQITLTGTRKTLRLKKGSNSVALTVNGIISNTFIFNLFVAGN